MQQFLNIWNALDTRRRFIVAAATIAVIAGVLSLTKMAAQPNMALLYSGLSPSAAGEVVDQLSAQGVIYDIRGNAIFVESPRRDELRLTLASQGLPANGGDGYELLDNLSGFGTTSQMFETAFSEGQGGRACAHYSGQSSDKGGARSYCCGRQKPIPQHNTDQSLGVAAGLIDANLARNGRGDTVSGRFRRCGSSAQGCRGHQC